MSDEWIKGSTSDTKYPKKAFNGILKAIYPSSTDEKGTPLLRADFEDGKSVSFFGLKVEDGQIKRFSGLDEFVSSLERLKINDYWALEGDNNAIGFRTDPDLIGCRLWLKPLEEQVVGDESQTKKSVFWGTLEKYECPKGEKPAAPKAKSEKPKPVSKELESALIDLLVKPMQLGDIYPGLNKKYKPSEIRATLDAMKVEGLIRQDGDKYVIV